MIGGKALATLGILSREPYPLKRTLGMAQGNLRVSPSKQYPLMMRLKEPQLVDVRKDSRVQKPTAAIRHGRVESLLSRTS